MASWQKRFELFVSCQESLNKVSPKTVQWYRQAWKRLSAAFDHPINSDRELKEAVEMEIIRQRHHIPEKYRISEVSLNNYIRAFNSWFTSMYEDGYLQQRVRSELIKTEKTVRKTTSQTTDDRFWRDEEAVLGTPSDGCCIVSRYNRIRMSQTSFLDTIQSNEMKNYEISLHVLQNWTKLVRDCHILHEKLFSVLTPPSADPEPDAGLAFRVLAIQYSILRREMCIAYLRLFQNYFTDSLMHLRKALEVTGMAYRISRHNELARIWAVNHPADEKAYAAYTKAFKPREIFPNNQSDEDYHPMMEPIYRLYDYTSKHVHTSMHGVTRYLNYSTPNTEVPVDVFDGPKEPDALLFHFRKLLESDWLMIEMFESTFAPYFSDDISDYTEQKDPLRLNYHNFFNRSSPIINEYINRSGK